MAILLSLAPELDAVSQVAESAPTLLRVCDMMSQTEEY